MRKNALNRRPFCNFSNASALSSAADIKPSSQHTGQSDGNPVATTDISDRQTKKALGVVA